MENLILFIRGLITVYTIIGCGVFLLCIIILYIWRNDEYVRNEKPFVWDIEIYPENMDYSLI